MAYTLPQNDTESDRNKRNQQLEDARDRYSYEYKAFITAKIADVEYPMVAEVPFADRSITKPDWAEKVISTLLRIRTNQDLYDVVASKGSILKLILSIRASTIFNDPQIAKLISQIISLAIFIAKTLSNLFNNLFKKDTEPKIEKIQPSSEERQDKIIEQNIIKQVKNIQARKITSQIDSAKTSFKSYRDLFQIIYLPQVADYVLEDRNFAAQRVAGANPLAIKQLSEIPANFPITDAQYQSVMGITDSLQQALIEQRLYVTDYKVLEEIEFGTIDNGATPKYLCQPIALFAIEQGSCPNRRLIPVAIQCYQEPSPENPIFTPPSLNSSLSEHWAWQMAKLTVQTADANYHEFISHLGGTHLWMEPIAISTYRQLAAVHPLSALLRPHLEGTLYINDSAIKGLVNKGGTVDKVAAGTLASSLLLSLKGAKGYPFAFNESFLPMTLEQRGVNDPKSLPDYPYRDDAILIWDAIHEWVSSYLKLFYLDDLAVQNDSELQNWIAELVDENGGRMSDIGEPTDDSSQTQGRVIKTLTYLIDAITLIIFTGSVQHAAVNFPQASWMTYMPNMPLAGYREAPKSVTGVSESDYFKLLPSLTQSEAQLNMTYLLGSVYYTKLGEYGDGYFADSRIQEPLQKFKEKLSEIELIINARNEVRSTHYSVLLPTKIPQSINI